MCLHTTHLEMLPQSDGYTKSLIYAAICWSAIFQSIFESSDMSDEVLLTASWHHDVDRRLKRGKQSLQSLLPPRSSCSLSLATNPSGSPPSAFRLPPTVDSLIYKKALLSLTRIGLQHVHIALNATVSRCA